MTVDLREGPQVGWSAGGLVSRWVGHPPGRPQPALRSRHRSPRRLNPAAPPPSPDAGEPKAVTCPAGGLLPPEGPLVGDAAAPSAAGPLLPAPASTAALPLAPAATPALAWPPSAAGLSAAGCPTDCAAGGVTPAPSPSAGGASAAAAAPLLPAAAAPGNAATASAAASAACFSRNFASTMLLSHTAASSNHVL